MEHCRKAIKYYEKDLKIATEIGDREGEGRAYANLGNAYKSLGDYQKPHEKDLKIATETGDTSVMLTTHWVTTEKPLSIMKNI